MLPYMWAAADKSLATLPIALTNGTTIFTITGGPIQILDLMAVCTVTNAGTATTLQWSSTPAIGSAQTISGASGSLTSCGVGSTVRLSPTAVTTGPIIALGTAGGVNIGTPLSANTLNVLNGTLTIVTATVLASARWYFCLRYRPLTMDSLVT